MPTFKEIAEIVRDRFGIGTKSYETTTFRKKHVDEGAKVIVVAVIEHEDGFNKVRKDLVKQTYRNFDVLYVTELKPDGCFDNEDFIDGESFFDAVEHFRKKPSDGDYYTEYVVDNFWMPGHLESLVELADEGIPVASMMQLHDQAGWDALNPPEYEFTPAECILWNREGLDAWDYNNEYRAVDNLMRGNPTVARTNKPTVVIAADGTS